MPPSSRAKLHQAADLLEEFTGHEPVFIEDLPDPDLNVSLKIGKVDAILYEAVRDGVKERYKHDFKKSARPLLVAKYDGSQVGLIGGSYEFTERGIVDR